MRDSMKLIFGALVLALFASNAIAADSPELRAAAADRYLKVVPVSRMLDDTFNELAKQVPPERRDQFLKQVKPLVRADMIERVSRESMVKVFTADEINALADFYSSQNGASIMKKFGVYMGMVMPVMQQEIQQALKKMKDQGGKN